MSTRPEPVPESGAAAAPAESCPLCGAQVGVNDARCPACNMTLAGVGARAPRFTRRSIWWWAVALVTLYLVVLAIVAAAR